MMRGRKEKFKQRPITRLRIWTCDACPDEDDTGGQNLSTLVVDCKGKNRERGKEEGKKKKSEREAEGDRERERCVAAISLKENVAIK